VEKKKIAKYKVDTLL